MRILIVDDEHALTTELNEFLTELGHVTTIAGNGKEAVDRLDETVNGNGAPFDVILSDIKMPLMDGIGLLAHARRRFPETHFILMTGYRDPDDAIAAVKHGATDFLRKPFKLVELNHVLENIRDRMELKHELAAKQEQLVKSQRLSSLGILAAGIMHEINNPNAFILGNADFLKRKILPILARQGAFEALERETAFTVADVLKMIDAIIRGSERITEIIKRTTSFNTLESPRPAVFDVRDALEFALKRLDHHLGSSFRLLRDVSDHEVLMIGSQEPLIQIFGNLVDNAIEAVHGRADSIIVVRLSGNGNVRIEIDDNGPGIDPARIPRLFEPFSTTKSDRPGRGLGLFIVHQLVSNMRGTISYERIDKNWSRFRVELPRTNDLLDAMEALQ